MTDLEQEILRQVHELSKDVIGLRERVAVLENRLSMPVRDGFPIWETTNGIIRKDLP
jgi:hypothetical protein